MARPGGALVGVVCLLLLAGSGSVVEGELLEWAECKICTFVVEKAWGEIQDDACYEIATELTGEAAALLSETGFAEVVEDPAVWGTVKWVCDKLFDELESYAGIGPDQICSDVGMCGGGGFRRRSADFDVFANLTYAGVKQIMHMRVREMKRHGIPVAVFPDGTVGYCYLDRDTGVYSCVERTSHTAPVMDLRSPAVITQAYTNQNAQSSSSSTNNTPLIVVSTLLAVALVAVAAVCGMLAMKLAAKKRTVEVGENSFEYAGSDHVQLGERLITESG